MSRLILQLIFVLWPGVCAVFFILMAGFDSDLTSFLFRVVAFVYLVFAPLVVLVLYETWKEKK